MSRPRPIWFVAVAGSAAPHVEAFASAGLSLVDLPWGRTVAPPDADALATALAQGPGDVLMLTSARALAYLPEGALRGRQALCVGARTAAAAEAAGAEATHVDGRGSEALAAYVLAHVPEDRRILWLRAADAQEAGVQRLEAAGRQVASLVAYQVVADADFARRVEAAPPPEALYVGSPRGVDALAALPEAQRVRMADAPVVAPGRGTAARARDAGLAATSAEDPSIAAIVAALLAALESR